MEGAPDRLLNNENNKAHKVEWTQWLKPWQTLFDAVKLLSKNNPYVFIQAQLYLHFQRFTEFAAGHWPSFSIEVAWSGSACPTDRAARITTSADRSTGRAACATTSAARPKGATGCPEAEAACPT